LQFLLAIRVQNVFCRERLPLVHSHIQIRFGPRGKTTGRLVKLMTAYTQVSEDSIYRYNSMKAQKPLQVTKVVWYENESFVSQNIPFCIRILVKSIQPPFGVQVSQDLR